jgi:hypothetical protein
VAVAAPSCPEDAEKVSACPDNIELEEVKTVAVIVTEFVPSLLTLVPVVESEIVDAAEVLVVVVDVVEGVPPQPFSKNAVAVNARELKTTAEKFCLIERTIEFSF